MKKIILFIVFFIFFFIFEFNCKKLSFTEAQISQTTQESKNIELMKAVESENIEKTEELLKNGANPNYSYKISEQPNDSMYRTLLGLTVDGKIRERANNVIKKDSYVGTDEKQLKIARLLLEYNADPNKNFFTLDKNGQEDYVSSNLGRAVINQDIPMIKLLIEYHSDPEKNSSSPLTNSAKSKEVLDLVIASGVDINQQDPTGFNCLMRAAEANDVEMVKAILAYQPNLALKLKPVNKLYNYKELTALEIAKIWGRENENEISKQKEIIRLLKQASAKK